MCGSQNAWGFLAMFFPGGGGGGVVVRVRGRLCSCVFVSACRMTGAEINPDEAGSLLGHCLLVGLNGAIAHPNLSPNNLL